MEGVVVAGGAMTSFNRRKDGSSWRDWTRICFFDAVADAGLEPNDIDALILASESDFFTLQLNPASVVADDIGLLSRSLLRVEGGGASGQLAVHAGAVQVLSGVAKRVAVIGVEPAASSLASTDMARLYGLSFDALTDGMTGVGAAQTYALSAQLFMQRTGAKPEDFASVSVRNHANAMANANAHLPLELTVQDVLASPPVASPFRRLDCSPLSDGAACLVLGRPEDLPGRARNRARLVGIGSANDSVRLGERGDPSRFAAKGVAAGRACSLAGIKLSNVDLVEVYDSFSAAQLQGLEGLGLAQDVVGDERTGRFAHDGQLPTNLSGGLLGQGAPIGAVGVAQVLTLARQLEGRYRGLTPAGNIKYGLADTHGGIATNCAVSIVEGP